MAGEAQNVPLPQRWEPSISDYIAIGAIAVGVILWAIQPNWKIGIPVALFIIGLFIFAAFRHRGPASIRAIVAIVAIALFVFLMWEPMRESFHKEYPRAAFNWPITLNPPATHTASANPPDMPPTNLPGPVLSKWGKSMFLCEFPENIVPQDPETVLAGIRQNLDIVGSATGLSMVINRIPYGFRIDVTANGPEGQLRMGALIQRFTVQIERASQGIFVTISFDVGALGILTMMPVDSESQKMLAKVVTQFTGIPEEKCRML